MKKQFTIHRVFDPKRWHVTLSTLWVISLLVACAGIITVALFATGRFLRIFQTNVTPTTSPVESISRDDLLRSTAIIDARMRDFDRFKNTPPSFPDPSR